MTTQAYGKYLVVRLLGRGGMAEVYQASDPVLDRRVAIKVIHSHLACEEGFNERFHHEAKLVASLRHPHIIQLYDYDVANGQPFMVMEFLEGRSLKERLDELRAKNEKMSMEEALKLLKAIGSALDYAHSLGAVHRDIKPANILFTSRDEPVLTDFGIAKMLSGFTHLTMTGSVVGSPAYMSPEQAMGKPVDSRSDLYSLGCVFYEMVTGKPPFEGDSPTAVMLQHVNAAPRRPSELNDKLSPAVEVVLLKALAKDPKDRFATAAELVRSVETALGGQVGAPSPAAAFAADATIIQKPDDATVVSKPVAAKATPEVAAEATVAGPAVAPPEAQAAGAKEVASDATVVTPSEVGVAVRGQKKPPAKRQVELGAVPEKEEGPGPTVPPLPREKPETGVFRKKGEKKSPVLIIAGVVIVAALAVGGFLVLGKGGSGDGNNSSGQPVITSLTAVTNTATPGGKVQIECVATDPQNQAITFQWTSDGGSFVNPSGNVVEWVAPAQTGTYNITATVANPKNVTAKQSLSISVSGARGPKIDSVVVRPDAVAPGKTAEVTCTASLPDGGTLDSSSYSWSADGGQIVGFGSKVTYAAPAQPGTYHIKVSVSDGKGGQADGAANVTVGGDQLKASVKATSNQTGTVFSDGKTDARTFVGDSQTDTSARAYFTFDIFPYAKRTITNATLTFQSKGVSGDPFTAQNLGGLYFEVVNFGQNAPAAKDFDAIGASPIPLSYHPLTQVDVTSQIMSATQSSERVFQVRLRFSNRSNNNATADSVEFSDAVLNISYK
jgi:tRNA A-37 threonylcarbamoyl transferase component Bud32